MSFSSAQFRLFLIVVWIVLLAGIFTFAFLAGSQVAGDALTRNTVRLALLYYGVALTLMLLTDAEKWRHGTGMCRTARSAWTMAWLAYLVHLAMAFHFYHGWSHADAVRHTQAVSGFGAGIYFSHLLTILWSLDVLYWWSRPEQYGRRPRSIGLSLHAYMLFIIFNATIVYESGFIRYAGCGLFLELIVVGWYCRSSLVANRPSAGTHS